MKYIFSILILSALLLTFGAFAAGGKNRGDDPFGNPGGNPVFDSDGNIVAEVIPLHCESLVLFGVNDDETNLWMCLD